MNDIYSPPNAQFEDEEELMRRRKRDALALRILVLLKLPMIIAGIIVSSKYSMNREVISPAVNPETLTYVFNATLILGSIISWIGLLLLKRWAGWLYTVTYVAMITILVTTTKPLAMHPYKEAIDWLSTCMSSAIIVLVFFSCALIERK